MDAMETLWQHYSEAETGRPFFWRLLRNTFSMKYCFLWGFKVAAGAGVPGFQRLSQWFLQAGLRDGLLRGGRLAARAEAVHAVCKATHLGALSHSSTKQAPKPARNTTPFR